MANSKKAQTTTTTQEPIANAAPQAAEAPSAAPVNTVAVTLADNIIGALRADGIAAYEADMSLAEFAKLFARVAPSEKHPRGVYELYEPMSFQWKIGNEAGRRGITELAQMESLKPTAAAQEAFDRRWRAAAFQGLLPRARPKSSSEAAVARDVSRTAEKAKKETHTAELLKLDIGATEALMLKAAASKDAAEAARLATLVTEAKEAADKAAKDAANEAVRKAKAAFDERVKLIRASGDANRIMGAWKALAQFVPAKAAS